MLLGQTSRFRIALPNAFMSHDPELSAVLRRCGVTQGSLPVLPRRASAPVADRNGLGTSFWMRTT